MKMKLVLPLVWFAASFGTAAQPIVYDPLDQHYGEPMVNGFKWVPHATWNEDVQVMGRGWSGAESLTVKMYGPLNSIGVARGTDRVLSLKNTNGVPLAGTSVDGTFRGMVRIPYDDGQIFAGSTPTKIPRPGFYHLIFTGTSSGESAVLGITIAPATTPGLLPVSVVGHRRGFLESTPERWDAERGGREGYLGQESPEGTDPHWSSVWSEEPVAFYGTVVPLAALDDSPSKVAEIDWLTDHYAHDLNADVTPDPEYQWICSTANKPNGFEGIMGHGSNNPKARHIELEWEHLNGGTPYRFNARTSSGFFIGCPLFVWPVPGDRVYVVGRWVMDVGHSDGGSRTEIHPPRLLATMRRLPTVLPLPGQGSNCLTRAAQVDIFISGHGGAANKFPNGLSSVLSGGKRIRDVLVKPNGLGGYAPDYESMKVYYRAGPNIHGGLLKYFEFFSEGVPTLVESFLPDVDLHPNQIYPTAGPSAFRWNTHSSTAHYADEFRPINDMNYVFDVPLPPRPEEGANLFHVATPNWFRSNATGLDSGNHLDTPHETTVSEIISKPWFNPTNDTWFVTVTIPCQGGDNKNYAKTIKFAWDVYRRPGRHYVAHMDWINIHHDGDPGSSDLPGFNFLQNLVANWGGFGETIGDVLNLFGKDDKEAEWHLWTSVGNEWRRLNLGPGPMQNVKRGHQYFGLPYLNHKVYGMIEPFEVYLEDAFVTPYFTKVYPAHEFSLSFDRLRLYTCGYEADDVDARMGSRVGVADGYDSAEWFVRAITRDYQFLFPVDSPEVGDNDNLGHAVFQQTVNELPPWLDRFGWYGVVAQASKTRPAGEKNKFHNNFIRDPGSELESHFSTIFNLREQPSSPHLNVLGSTTALGSVCPGEVKDFEISYQNAGDADLHLTGLSIDGNGYSVVTTGPWPIVVKRDEIAQVKIRFAPTSREQGSGTLTFLSNDPCQGGRLAVALSVLPPRFEPDPALVGLPAMKSGASAWGDIDQDGDLDLLMTGTTNSTASGVATRLLRAITGGFVDVTPSTAPGLPGVMNSAVAWGDYDNDGRLDFLLTGTTNGSTSGAIAQLWRNQGSAFVNVSSQAAPGLPGVMRSSVAWGDYDNDGHLDFLITGANAGGRVAQLWRYTPRGFSNVTSQTILGLRGVELGSVAWADFDGDGLLDFVLTGTTSGSSAGAIAQLWRNTGSRFIDTTSQSAFGLRGAMESSIAWGDYDLNGHLDLLLNGRTTSNTLACQLWKNTGDKFEDASALISDSPQFSKGTVAWGDFDNTGFGNLTKASQSYGRLEFLITGEDSNGVPHIQVRSYLQRYRLSTNSSFVGADGQTVYSVTRVPSGFGFDDSTSHYFCGVSGLKDGNLAAGDYDDDGRLDFLLAGASINGEPATRLYRNNSAKRNRPPSAPTNLVAVLNGEGGVTFNWSAASDDITPQPALSYNLSIGSSASAVDIASPQADLVNGFRRVVRFGAVTAGTNQSALTYRFTGLPYAPRYYCSVEAIDGAFAGGAFAPLQVVTLPTRTTVTSTRCDGPGTLREAIRQSSQGGTITFSPALSMLSSLEHGSIGFSDEPIRISVDCGELIINKDLNIIGPGPEQIIISAEGNNRVFHITSNYPPNRVTLAGLTIANGSIRARELGYFGGAGILNHAGILTVSNCVVRDNQLAYGSGGGIASIASTVGSGIPNASLTVLHTTLSDNAAPDGGGGGIRALRSDVIIRDSSFTGNSAGTVGGGILTEDSDLYTTDYFGTPGYSASLLTSTFNGNSAVGGGGGLAMNRNGLPGMAEVLQCTFSANSADAKGGGIFLLSDIELTVSQSTFYGNYDRAYQGHAIYHRFSALSISHNIFASPVSQPPLLPAVGGSSPRGEGTNSGFNLWDTNEPLGQIGFGDVRTADARLAPLANYGGPTLTHALLPGSPAINAGSADGTGYDQRGPGFPRRVGSQRDIGAFELGHATLVCPADIVRNNTVGRCDAQVTFSMPASGPVTCLPPSGATFPIGTTLVSCLSSNVLSSTNCSFRVTVRDAQRPSLQCPTNLTFAASAGSCFRSNVNFSVPVSDNCPGVRLVCFPPAGSDFATGTTTVNCTAIDAASNRTTGAFTVTVQDRQAPVFGECPANFITTAPIGSNSTVVVYDPRPSDNCGVVAHHCDPPSGSAFPLGITPVTCNAADAAGNTNACSFFVTVLSGCWPSLTVVNTNDSGEGSLRQALADVCSGGTIEFTNALRGQIIVLTSGELTLERSVTLLGLGADQLTVSGHGRSRVFYNPPGITSVVAGLTIAAGNGAGTISSGSGGGLLNRGALTVDHCALIGNAAPMGGGGAINNSSGTLLVQNSSLSGNAASANGGGIANIAGSRLTVQNSTLSGNTATNNGGGIHNNNSTVTLLNCTATGNWALGASGGGLGASGSEHVTNCIIAGNFRNTGAIAGDISGAVASGSHNLIGNAGTAGNLTDGVDGNIVGNGGSGIRPIVSILDTNLAFNGGPSRTHALQIGSPGLNAGTPSFPANLSFDQRGIGFRRVQGGRLDIGAYEVQTPAAFTPIPITSLLPVSFSSLAWGDYDNDGRLDLLITGSTNHPNGPVTQLWRNTSGGFAQLNVPGLPRLTQGSVAWGDYDNDGWLDFFLTGLTDGLSNAVSQLWRNTGIGFAQINVPGLPGLTQSSVDWGDYDNDGRLDLLLTGATKSNGLAGSSVAQIWRNTGSGFSNVTGRIAASLPGVSSSAAGWGDYDSDGRLDFLLTGNAPSATIAQLWRNTGNGFSNMTSIVAAGLSGVAQGSVAWADYDSDGKLDFLLTGRRPSSTQIAQLWRNTGHGFSNVTAQIAAALPGVQQGAVAWGDYDNDGRPDLLLSGGTGSNGLELVTQLWRNTGHGFSNVTDEIGIDLSAVRRSSAAWGDFDNDGRLDLLLAGGTNPTDDGAGLAQLWRNVQPLTPNSPPTAPAGLSAQFALDRLTLNWQPATDDRTAAVGLSYNLLVGTNAGAVNIASPHANASTGFRRVVRRGAVNSGTNNTLSATFDHLPIAPVYYWSVQAIDSSFAGGLFAPIQTAGLPTAITVTSTNCSGPGSLREAIAASTPGGTITFGPALQGKTIFLTCGRLVIDKSLTITGPGADLLALDGVGASQAFLIASNSPPNIVTLTGLTITNGFGNSGGGVASISATLTVDGCKLTGNRAGNGGALLNSGGVVVVRNSVISANQGSNGGGLGTVLGGTTTLENSTVAGNSADNAGGGIFNAEGGLLLVRQSTLTSNAATNTGGAIHNERSVTTVSDSTLESNWSRNGGGGISDAGGVVTLENSTVYGNASQLGSGGGIHASNGMLSARNSTFSGNRAADLGGGISAATTATNTIMHCTFSGNQAPSGGAIANAGPGVLSVTHTLLARGTSGLNFSGPIGSVLNQGFNLADDGSAAAFAPNIGNLLLGSLANNGGLTRTHALMPGSPAIDAGTNTAIAGLPYDQRGPGFVRLFGERMDIGAYEVRAVAPTIACGGDIHTNLPAGDTAVVVTWTAPIANGTDLTIECLPPSGALFEVGQTLVQCRAANAAGAAACEFTVAVCAANLLVTTTGDSVPGSLRAAIACALPGGTITFAPALNGETLVLTGGELVLDKSLNILGPGPGHLAVSGNDNSRVFYVAPGTSNRIVGLTIAHGNGAGAVLNGAGAGILSDGATLTVSNCVLTAHGGNAAAVHNYATAAGGRLRVQNCELSASRYGIRSDGPGAPDLVLQDSTLVRNGTGLASSGPAATLLMERCNVISNSTGLLSGNGGGIASGGRSAVIRFTTIHGNAAQNGGGIYLSGNGAAGELQVENCTLSANAAQYGGALYFDADGTSGTAPPVTIVNSTFSGNSAQYRGGAILNIAFFTTADLTLRHCTLSGNSAPTGGGIYNQVNFSGGAVVRLSHTLLAHGAAGGNYVSDGGTISGLGFNLADDATAGAAAASVLNLLLAPLADNGGLTLTHALLPGSAALNAGTNGAVASVPNDQRGPGYPRLLGGAVDLGAYEQGAPPVLTCPANVVTNVADGSGTVAVNWILSPDGLPAPGIVCSPSSGASFPLGTTAVACTASNALGQSKCNFTVTVCAARLTVTTAEDDGPGSLRQALLDICPGGIVAFAPALSGQTVELIRGELPINRNVTIEGPGANRLALSGAYQSRVFSIAAGAEVRLSGLSVIHGRVDSSQRGGGIRNSGVLILSGCVVRDCEVVSNGANDANAGGIMNEAAGTLILTDCTVHDNAAYYGSGIYNNGRLTVAQSTISGNTAAVFGAGLLNWGSASLRFVTFAENHGAGGGSGLQVGGGPVTFEHCLFAANVPKNIDGGGTRTSLGRNISSDGTGNLTAPGDRPNTDPRIGPLRDNGGPTPTHALLPDSPAINVGLSGLPNAWQIADVSTVPDTGVLAYTTNLTAAQRFAATNDGWRLSVVNRLVAGSGGASPAHFMIYGNGVRRFVVSWNTNAQGQLTAALNSGGTTILTAAGADAFAYHTHELVYNSATRQATYWFDGTNVLTWAGSAPDANQNGIVQWGTGSSSGRGTMNYHRVRFSVESLGTVAEYRGGVEGNPVVAPSPTNQGWTLTLPATVGAVTNTPVSPDTLRLPFSELANLGLAYDQRGPGYPRLVGGHADLGAYEWRTIPIQLACPGNVTTNVSDGTDVIAVTWAPPVATSELVPALICSPESGSYFPVGPTPVICTASHGAGLVTCSFTVTVCASNLTVTSALDSGPGSLRQTIANACAGGTIAFDSALKDQIIAVLGDELVVNRNLTILGPGADRLVILGDGTNRVLRIASNSPPISVAIRDLTLAHGGGQGGGVAGRGGAVYNDHAILSLSRCTIRDSVASSMGGGIYNFGASGSATLTIRDSTLSGNSSVDGGAIFNDGLSGNSALAIYNSTLSGNLATNSGGGIYNDGESGSATLTLEHSTLAGNASGDAVIRNEAGALTIGHTLLAKGSSGSNYVSAGGSVVNLGYNLANDNSAGAFAIQVANLLLGPLANNGGPTMTHALLPTSPAINAGLASVATDLPYDQRGLGFPRLADAARDIGAYETQVVPLTLVCPEDRFVSVPDGTNNVVVTWTNPIPTGVTTAPVMCEPPFGTVFSVGKTIVNCTASNATSKADCSFTVNVCAAHILVTNGNDNGHGSLRRAMVDTCPGGRITFAPGLYGQAIELTGSPLVAANDVRIIGPGANLLTINARGLSRVFRISAGVNCVLSGLTITGGTSSAAGGGILHAGSSLVVSDCIISGNSALLNGGAIHQSGGGTLTVHSSSVVGNFSGRFGGGLANMADSTLLVVNSTVSGNWSFEDGGGIYNGSASLLIQHSTLAGNSTGASAGGIYSFGTAASVTMGHTLLAKGVSGANYAGNGQVIDAGFNLSDDSSTEGFAAQVSDLLIAPALELTGSALTHRLRIGSPAIDNGTTGPIVGLPFDQRGAGFVRDANGRVDIGAYEVQQPAAVGVGISAGGVTLTLKGEPNEILTMEWSSDVRATGWQRLGDTIADAQGNLHIVDPSPLAGQRFYRAVRK